MVVELSSAPISESIIIIAAAVASAILAAVVVSMSSSLASSISSFFSGYEERALTRVDLAYLICNRTGDMVTGIVANVGETHIPSKLLEERYMVLVGPPGSEECPQCIGASISVIDASGDGILSPGEVALVEVAYPDLYVNIYGTSLASMVVSIYGKSVKAYCSFP